ncbi:cell division suppressor protein YneA [Jeotgalibacillus aurantiacus]|uniref:cell division suppressor protein YneA n=1 Tax=Jeotgalibacillus aurantiacus TaxID=2763266 RepID=UPI001D0B37C3|nr:LysM peptidoglycan-binding domain-containing protein [Jeotgalibacillus aurantiacus]
MTTLWKKYSFVILFFIVTLFFSLFLVFTTSADEQSSYKMVQIQEGDSLWKIAEEYAEGASMSEREFIDWVSGSNQLNSSYIYPGDELVIPLKKEWSESEFDSIQLASNTK